MSGTSERTELVTVRMGKEVMERVRKNVEAARAKGKVVTVSGYIANIVEVQVGRRR